MGVRVGVRVGFSTERSNGRGHNHASSQVASLHVRCARGSRNPVRPPVLIHNHSASQSEPASVIEQTVKYVVAIGNGRPAHPECIADAGLPLLGGFGDGGRAPDGTH